MLSDLPRFLENGNQDGIPSPENLFEKCSSGEGSSGLSERLDRSSQLEVPAKKSKGKVITIVVFVLLVVCGFAWLIYLVAVSHLW